MRDRLRILYTAYPLLPVNEDSCGGAEQALATVEAEIARRGHWTAVAGCDSSRAVGNVVATGPAPLHCDQYQQRETEHTQRVLRFLNGSALSGDAVDLVHDHSGSFWRYAAGVGAPVLATLHLPRSFYPAGVFEQVPANVFFNCVSESQRRAFADVPQVLGTVHNGVRLQQFPVVEKKGDYLLWMGRICEEKGAHVAIRVARAAGMKLILAGSVYPFSYHQQYFDREIHPKIAGGRLMQYVGTATQPEKIRLLGSARALLVTSLVEETSSLVAMEAMACGTPVVAFARGALPEVVAHGVTGFVVDGEEQMTEAIWRSGEISPQTCRERVEAKFSSERMAQEYERMYWQILAMFRAGSSSVSAA